MAAMIQIDGVNMPDPSVFKIKEADLDSEDTKRNELGYLQRDRVRQGARSLTLEWDGLTGSDATTVINAVSPVSFRISFPDTDGRKTITAYAGDRTKEYVNTPDIGPHWNVSFENIEF
jgi:hypothetical protein